MLKFQSTTPRKNHSPFKCNVPQTTSQKVQRFTSFPTYQFINMPHSPLHWQVNNIQFLRLHPNVDKFHRTRSIVRICFRGLYPKSCPQNQVRIWNTDLTRSKKDGFISSCQGVFKAAICFRLSTRFFRNVAYVKPMFVHFAVQLVLFFAFVHFPFSVLPSYAISPTLRALSARRLQNASSSASSQAINILG